MRQAMDGLDGVGRFIHHDHGCCASPLWLVLRSSKSARTVSQMALGSIGVEEPPGMTARRLSQPPRTPPACFSMSSLREMLISSSTTIGLLTCPEIANNLVPELFLRPKPANHGAPRRQISGATETVSTLATVEGHPKAPMAAGNGGFIRGLPILPSRDSMRPVSSPQM